MQINLKFSDIEERKAAADAACRGRNPGKREDI